MSSTGAVRKKNKRRSSRSGITRSIDVEYKPLDDPFDPFNLSAGGEAVSSEPAAAAAGGRRASSSSSVVYATQSGVAAINAAGPPVPAGGMVVAQAAPVTNLPYGAQPQVVFVQNQQQQQRNLTPAPEASSRVRAFAILSLVSALISAVLAFALAGIRYRAPGFFLYSTLVLVFALLPPALNLMRVNEKQAVRGGSGPLIPNAIFWAVSVVLLLAETVWHAEMYKSVCTDFDSWGNSWNYQAVEGCNAAVVGASGTVFLYVSVVLSFVVMRQEMDRRTTVQQFDFALERPVPEAHKVVKVLVYMWLVVLTISYLVFAALLLVADQFSALYVVPSLVWSTAGATPLLCLAKSIRVKYNWAGFVWAAAAITLSSLLLLPVVYGSLFLSLFWNPYLGNRIITGLAFFPWMYFICLLTCLPLSVIEYFRVKQQECCF